MQPLISIVIPTYNHAHFLKRALESLQNQTYSNWEAIIIDNHSKDSTDAVVEEFMNPKIKLLKIHNGGVIAASRNKGILEAKGEWIAFLDSDDWWKPEKLMVCVKAITDKIDFIYHDLKVVGQKPSKFDWIRSDRTRQLKKEPLLDMLISGNPISNSSVIVRKKILYDVGRLNESQEMIGAEDFNIWLKIATVTNRFLYISQFLGYYEFHSNGVSRKNMSECYQSASNEFLPLLDPKSQKQVFAHIQYMNGRYLMAHKKNQEAKKQFQKSIKTGNFNIMIKSIFLLVSLKFIRLSQNVKSQG